jgi:hypothetical protein
MDGCIIKIASPIYLLRASEICWECGSRQEVIALATRHLSDCIPEANALHAEDEPLMLDNIIDMPPAILEYLRSVHPRYEKRANKTAGFAYYVNTCSCGAHFGDYMLHLEPHGAFWPDSKEQAGRITIEELPFTGTFDFICSYGIGLGAFIFEHAQKRAAT